MSRDISNSEDVMDSRLPFSFASDTPQRPGDVFDAWLDCAAFTASVFVLLAAGGAAGFWVGVWLFN